MAVSINSSTEGPTSTALSTANPQTFGHSNLGGSLTKGVVVVIVSGMGTTGNDVVTGVTYQSVAMTRVRTDVVTAGDEPGRTYIYFLGSGIDTGSVGTVSIAKTDTTGTWATCMTFTADENMVVQDHDGISGVMTNPSVTLQDPSFRAGMAAVIQYSGVDTLAALTIPTDASGAQHMQPELQNIDIGAQTTHVTVSGQTHGNVICGWNQLTEDAALSAVLVGESTSIQLARPDSTIQGNRSGNIPGTRHGAMSDQNDDTYIAGSVATNDIWTLSNVIDPGGNTNYSMWVRGNGTTGTGTGTLSLYQGSPLSGGTLIANWSGMPGTTYATDQEYVLQTTDVDAITDFNNLYVQYSKTSGTANKTLQEIFFETPGIPFTATTVSGLKGWYDFADIASLWQEGTRTTAITADGQGIGGVTDKSTTALHLLQNTPGMRPLYKTGIISGRSVARFDGTDDQFVSNTVTADTSWTAFFVMKERAAATTTSKTVWSMSNPYVQLLTDTDLGTGYVWRQNAAGGAVSLGGVATDTNVVALRINSASSLQAYVNGGPPATFDPDDAVTTAGAAGYYFGSLLGANYGDFDVGEVLMYNTALSDTDMNTVGNYLATKWGFTWSVPTTAVVASDTATAVDTATKNIAITVIQKGANYSIGSLVGSISCTPTAGTAGALYLCAVGNEYPKQVCSTVTGGGLTWTKEEESPGGTTGVSIWRAIGTLTATSVTATFASTTREPHIAVFEVTGTTTVGQSLSYTSDAGPYYLYGYLGEMGSSLNRTFIAGMAFHSADGTAAIIPGGSGNTTLDFHNGYDGSLEAGFGGYYGWCTGWYSNAHLDPYVYDQGGNANQYMDVIALELGTPWVQGPGFSTIVSNANIYALSAGGRTIDYCQNGNLWAVLVDQSGANQMFRFYYSTNQGATWTESTGSAVGSGESLFNQAFGCALFIDKDDYAHFVYSAGGAGYPMRYRLGTPNGSRTSWTWGSPINFTGNGGGSFNRPGMDVVAHREVGGTGWYVHIVWCCVNGSNYSDINWTYLRYNSSHTILNNVTNVLWQPYMTQEPIDLSLDFRHTTTDPKVVQSSTPSLYWCATDEDGNTGLYFQKLTYSGGSWSQGTITEIDGNSQAGVPAQNQLIYDGTRVLLMHVRQSAQEVWVEERDEADTTTGLIGNGNSVDAGFIANATMAYDSNQNIYLLAKGYPGYDYKKAIYNRAATTWSLWSQVEPDDSYDGFASACLMRGPESFVPIGAVYEVYIASPDQARYGTLLANTSAPAGAEFAGFGLQIN